MKSYERCRGERFFNTRLKAKILMKKKILNHVVLALILHKDINNILGTAYMIDDFLRTLVPNLRKKIF